MGLNLEDDLNFWGKLKTTSIFKENGRRPQFSRKMEEDLNFFSQMKDDLNISIIKLSEMYMALAPKTSKSTFKCHKTMQVSYLGLSKF